MHTVATGIGISRVGQIAINAHDVERAAAFYQDALGLQLLFKAGPGLAFFDCGGVRLMFDPLLCRGGHPCGTREDEGKRRAFRR